MRLLPHSISRHFSCKHKRGSEEKQSTTPPYLATSVVSHNSRPSPQAQYEAFFEDKCPHPSSRPNVFRRLYPTQPYYKSNIDMDADEVVPWVKPINNCEMWMSSASSAVFDFPHDCQCKTRSTCPEFLQNHFAHVQMRDEQRLAVIMLIAYFASAHAYAQAREALCLPAAKLERAKAEYDWILNRQKRTLWAPHLQDQLLAARKKVVAAEAEWDLFSRRRWQKAQFMVNIARF